MNHRIFTPLALATLTVAASVGAALAANNDERQEAIALRSSKITLCQAIATAEQQTGGRAYDAGADIKNGSTRIAVETNGARGVQTVTVDAQSGQVINTSAGAEQD